MFCLEERLRVRIKVHARKKKNGFCSLSVTVACQPKKYQNADPISIFFRQQESSTISSDLESKVTYAPNHFALYGNSVSTLLAVAKIV